MSDIVVGTGPKTTEQKQAPVQLTQASQPVTPAVTNAVFLGSQDPDSWNYGAPVTPPTIVSPTSPTPAPYVAPTPTPTPAPAPPLVDYTDAYLREKIAQTPGGQTFTQPAQLTPEQTQKVNEATFTAIQDYLQSPEGQRVEELVSQNQPLPVYTVTVDGNTTEFNDYVEAQQYAVKNSPIVVTTVDDSGNEHLHTFSDPDSAQRYIDRMQEGYVVAIADQQAMNSYLDKMGGVLNLPLVKQFRDINSALSGYGQELDREAKEAKKEGKDALAGALYSAGTGLRFGTGLVFGAASLPETVYVASTKPGKIIDAMKADPIVTAANLAVLGFGAYDAATGLKGYLSARDAAAGSRITLTNQGEFAEFKLPSPYDVDEFGASVARTYPDGSPVIEPEPTLGRTLSTQWESGETAYAMVELDHEIPYQASVTQTARTPYFMFDAPVYTYHAPATLTVPTGGLLASALASIGLTSISNPRVETNLLPITSIAAKPVVVNIVESGSKVSPLYTQRNLSELNSIIDAAQDLTPVTITDVISDHTPIQVPDSVTDQTPIQIPDVVPIEEPIPDVIPEVHPPEPHPPKPGPGEKPPKPRIKGKSVPYRRREDERRETSEVSSFAVRMRYGRRTTVKRVDAATFREALSKVLRGSPSEVEVRRL